MKKSVSTYNTFIPVSGVIIDSSLKERRLTEDNSPALKKKMDTSRAFIKDHGLVNFTKISKK